MFRHFVPSRELHPLATLVRLSLVDLPSANGFDKPSAASKFELYAENNPPYDCRHTEDSLFYEHRPIGRAAFVCGGAIVFSLRQQYRSAVPSPRGEGLKSAQQISHKRKTPLPERTNRQGCFHRRNGVGKRNYHVAWREFAWLSAHCKNRVRSRKIALAI